MQNKMFFGIPFIPFFALILFNNIDNKIGRGIVVFSFIISICFSRMAGDAVADGQTFSTTVGLLYVFNLIVGTGALALPSAFQAAGYILGIILLFISAFTSYICATFILESMAIANCVLRRQSRFGGNSSTELAREGEANANQTNPDDDSSLFCAAEISPDFAITKRVELSEMAHLFLGRAGTLFAYFVLIVYLFGDLAVYSSTVPKSLMNVLCSSLNSSSSPSNFSIPCHSKEGDLLHEFSRFTVYQFCILAFLTFCLPMVLMGMTKTKWLQLGTTLCRWTAFLLMIVMASVQLAQNGPKGSPSAANPQGFASLFGVAVYAFMCHHSIPGLVTPIRDKSNLSAKLVSVYALIYLFYCALSLSGSFAFAHVQDIYTINFLHDDQTGGFWNALLDYFLALFPVFVLTSSYIIVAITLSNNVRVLLALILGADFGNGENAAQRLGGQSHQNEQEALLGDEQTGAEGQEEDAPLNFHSSSQPPFPPNPHSPRTPSSLLRQFGIPFVVVAIPGLLSLITDNVLLLASITGSFPGVGVQFVLPALLILGARRALSFRVGCSASLPPHLRSPFSHWFWPFGILCWAFLSIIVVFLNIFHLGA